MSKSKISSIVLSNHVIGSDQPPFIIAEMSGNHNRSLETALAIVDAAADSGAHAVKIQTYTADTMTIDADREDFRITDKKSLWYGKTLYQLYEEAATPWDWHDAIISRCKERSVVCFSTPFDETAVDFLEDLNVPCYKIASFENTDIPLIRKVAGTGKPLLISSGMATMEEITEMVEVARASGCRDLVLLKCTSTYPADPSNSNILSIPDMRERYRCQIGLSDHTLGIGAAIAAVAHGAVVIEKHFTLDRAAGGVDAAFSMEPGEMRLLVDNSLIAWQSLGSISYGPLDDEKTSLLHRRSLYIVEDMEAGDTINAGNMRAIRPGYGLPPKYYDGLINRKVNRKVARGTPLSWDMVS